MKGITSSQLIVLLALVVFGMATVVTVGSTGDALDFVSAQTVDQQVQRVANAMIVMETVPAGHMELKMAGYEVRYRPTEKNLSLNYSGNIAHTEIDENMVDYSNIDAPANFEMINSSLCLRKTQESSGSVLKLNTSGC